MPLSRRRFLALTGAVAASTGLSPAAVAQTLQSPAGRRAAQAAEWTTLAQRLGPGVAGNLGYRPVVTLPGRPIVTREDIAKAQDGRQERRQSLLCFVHLTDQHIVDSQSTTRVEFIDRYANGQCPADAVTSAHRPQETASARVSDAMLKRLRRVGASPVTGAPIRATISTGDNTDNQQHNELDIFLGLMNGGQVRPQSGDKQRYEGVQASGNTDYWHPDPAVRDRYKTVYGYPDRDGWLETALSPFEAVGAGALWYSCYGNHDGLAQGNSPVTPAYSAIATSEIKAVGAPGDTTPCPPEAFIAPPAGAPVMRVTADPERAYIHRREWIKRHLEVGGVPAGHGFSQANVEQGRAYYTADHGRIRWIVLDTVNPGGYASGNIGDAQLAWLDEQLQIAQRERRYVILFSHHGPRSLDNPVQTPDPFQGSDYQDLPRHQAPAVLDVVNKYSCVIAWVNGHTHNNIVTARGQWWDIGTAAHIDWPSQSRIIDVVDNHDGTLSIFGILVDHDDDPVAAFARELAGNDPQKGFGYGDGKETDQNVELVLTDPFAGEAADAGAPGAGKDRAADRVPSSLELPATGLPANLTLGGALAVAGALGVARLRMEAARRGHVPASTD